MAGNKTTTTGASVQDYIASRATGTQVDDAKALLAFFKRVTGEAPRMWGPSIVGYGSYRYTYESGRSGESCLTGFALRGREFVLYLMAEGDGQQALLAKLGKHKSGKSCVYFKRWEDLDPKVLEQLVAGSISGIKALHG